MLAAAAGALAVVSVRGASGVHGWAIAGFVPGYVAAGYLLARHRPQVPFGWLFLSAGLVAAMGGLGAAYCGAALVEDWSGAAWGIWFTSWALPLEGMLAAVAVLYFPDGRIDSRAVETSGPSRPGRGRDFVPSHDGRPGTLRPYP